MSMQEIETILKNKNDFVKIDLLTRFIDEERPEGEIKKVCYMMLGEIYERSLMFNDSAKCYDRAGELSPWKEKKNLHIKAAQLYIRGGDFQKAEGLIKNAVSESSTFERKEMLTGFKKYCIFVAESLERTRKLGDAIKVYEKTLLMELSDEEKRIVRERLMNLYQKLGKVREYLDMKSSLGRR
ncbi:MAG: hypothetical protein WC238_05660 [Parcubacteria group bacterium]